jgi:hypothetical protein
VAEQLDPQLMPAGLEVTVPSPRSVLLTDRVKNCALTVRLSVVVFVKPPELPVMVTVTVPVAAVLLAVNVNVLLLVGELVGLGLNAAITPLGRVEVDRVTLPLKPFCGVTVIVLCPLLPWVIVTLLGEADRV